MKVSIITVCFNSESTIQNTFDSIRNQTYNSIELIVIDGGSKDGTLEIIEANKDIISKMISEPDQGLYDAMNKGINMAIGDIVGILNSDDIYSSRNVISEIVSNFAENDMVYGNIDYVNVQGKHARSWKSSPYQSEAFLKGWHPPHPSLFVKRDVYIKYGCFDISLTIAADFDLMLRFFEKHQLKSIYIDKTIVTMTAGGASGTFSGIMRGNKEINQSFKKNNIKKSNLYFLYRYLPKIKAIIFK